MKVSRSCQKESIFVVFKLWEKVMDISKVVINVRDLLSRKCKNVYTHICVEFQGFIDPLMKSM